MANTVSLKNWKRSRAHGYDLKMRLLKAMVEVMKLGDKSKDINTNEVVQEKTATLER